MIAFTSTPTTPTDGSSNPVQAADPYLAMMRGALLPTAAVGGLALAVAAVLEGTGAGTGVLVGTALGAALVVVFFGLTLTVMRAARNVAPEMSLGVALALYSTKVAVLGAAVLGLRDESWLSPTALAVTAMACAVAWLVGQVRGLARARLPIGGAAR